MAIEKWVDLALLVMSLVVGVSMLALIVRVSNTPIAAVYEDKTTVQSIEEIQVDKSMKTGKDVLMCLVVADDLMPYPRAIRLNDTPVVYMTDDWLTSKNKMVAEIYKASGSYNLKSMLDWNVTDVQYVYDGGSGYFQYVLSPQ